MPKMTLVGVTSLVLWSCDEGAFRVGGLYCPVGRTDVEFALTTVGRPMLVTTWRNANNGGGERYHVTIEHWSPEAANAASEEIPWFTASQNLDVKTQCVHNNLNWVQGGGEYVRIWLFRELQ